MFREDFLRYISAPPSGEDYRIHDGYLDLLGPRPVGDSAANFSNYLPGVGATYEPLWRVRSLSLLTGEDFPNERELGIISEMARVAEGGLFLDLGCSAGLYTRNFARTLSGNIIGIDLSPSMLREAVRKARSSVPADSRPSFVRADAKRLPFVDGVFDGAVCGGSLNEFGDPARVLRETARVMKPGGRLAVMGILEAATQSGRRLQRFLSTGGIKFFSPEEVSSVLDHSGFSPDPLTTFGPVFFAGATRR